MTLVEVHVKWSMIFMDLLGPDIFSTLWMKGFNFPGQNKLIFTVDITSLYTVIPNDEGLRALKHFFDQRTYTNCLSLRDLYYKQVHGVAMGTKMGPS